MSNQPVEDDGMPVEIDFSKGTRALHHIPPDAKVFLPASIERTVWLYFSEKAQQKGVDLLFQRFIDFNVARRPRTRDPPCPKNQSAPLLFSKDNTAIYQSRYWQSATDRHAKHRSGRGETSTGTIPQRSSMRVGLAPFAGSEFRQPLPNLLT